MKKNKEWLKSEVTMRISGDREKGPLINVDIGLQQALDLIDQLEEPELPVVQQFVADWFEENKENVEEAIFSLNIDCYKGKRNEITDWANFIPSKAIETLIKMKDGYKIEGEKRYRLCCYLPQASEEKFYLTYATSQEEWYIDDYVPTNVLRKTIFTETELLKIDETGFERVEVE